MTNRTVAKSHRAPLSNRAEPESLAPLRIY
jgi:hypothetical protein